jgi:predicted XRE-type DNA-binding protein
MSDKENKGPVRGSGDFLRDMAYENPDEMRVKFALANNIALTIEDRGLKQADAAKLAGLAQPDISRIVNGVVKDYAVFRLMSILASLGKDISIGISDASSGQGTIMTAEPERSAALSP